MASEIVWRPTGAYLKKSNIRRFMDKHDIDDYDGLVRRSIEERDWFWNAVVEDANVEWFEPYTRVYDDSRGIEWARWFVDGKINIVHNVLDRHALSSRRDKLAFIWASETGEERMVTYGELYEDVNRFANGLRSLGIGRGDPVCMYMPMVPEIIVAFLAILKIGAIAVPIFSAFGPEAVRTRLEDVDARIVLTADGSIRHGRTIEIKAKADQCVEGVGTVEKIIVLKRLGNDIPWKEGRDVWWDELVSGQPEECRTEEMDSEDTAMLLYSSGTTGKPKGTVHTHGGSNVQVAKEVGYYMDVKEGDVLFWVTDIGWMMGPWQILGAQHHGATHFIYEGGINHPAPDKLWELVERYSITGLGISPTLVRVLIKEGDEWVARHDLSSLRMLGSTGEPWDDSSWNWLFEKVGKRRLPIINISGGTELFGCLLSPLPITDLKPKTLRGPGLGMDIDCLDENGKSVRGGIGTLVCRNVGPSMTRGFWGDPERYIETYWSHFPGMWYHADLAHVDADGFWFLLGRADDLMKISGMRVGPADIETALIDHGTVSEAAAFGVPDETTGEAIVCFAVLKPGNEPSDDLRKDLREHVGDILGKPFRPRSILFVEALPKTRSGKIVRRTIKNIYIGSGPVGDVSTLENPEALDGIRRAV